MSVRLPRTAALAASLACLACLGCVDPPAAEKDGGKGGPTGTATSHLGRPASDHVTLEMVGGLKGGYGPDKLDFVRVLPDGTTEKTPDGLGWRVPEGRVLVVTDVDWQYQHPEGEAGKLQVLRLMVEGLGERPQSRRAFESAVVLSPQGAGAANVSMTAGFVVSSKARIAPDLTPGPRGGLQHAIVRGYMMPE